ncbi:hypothetical protein E2C01_072098 [Portunus trituberculatus]|uniref:Uncharacterized protein n=1 Tax=Portunus trituberculatus TaxID=210409 RepID=A0A5B7HZ15_PORTR|nr:hypothetical protein [Portunus trituberculatus]
MQLNMASWWWHLTPAPEDAILMERKTAGTLVQVQDSMWMRQKKNGKRIIACTPMSPRSYLLSLQKTSKWQVTRLLSWGTGNHILTSLFCSFHLATSLFKFH